MLELIRQPPGSNLCGHACVAMVAGVSLARAIEVIGHWNGTKTKEIVTALETLGVSVNKLKRGKPPKGTVSVAIAWPIDRKRSQGWHWVVIDQRGKMLDPSRGNLSHILYDKSYKITSYLEIDMSYVSCKTSELVPRPPMWTLLVALALVRKLRPKIIELGFTLELGGGVLQNGFSNKDLDLVLVPRANYSEFKDIRAVLALFRELDFEDFEQECKDHLVVYKLKSNTQSIDLICVLCIKSDSTKGGASS